MKRPGGGVVARRAVVRWALRLFRREWRQQVLVLSLIAVAVGAATFMAVAAYRAAEAPEGEFGTANLRLSTFVEGDTERVAADIVDVREAFGAVEVIGHRDVPVPASVDTIELRIQEPHGVFGAPMLALREGRYPTGTDEVAVTDAVADTFSVDIGAPLDLDGSVWTVVGIVENPARLIDEFALADPASVDPMRAERVTVLTEGTEQQLDSSDAASRGGWDQEQRYQSEGAALAGGVFGLATVALVLVSLVAAAGFVVVAQRRQRQLGMLAAVGATEKHLRLVMLMNGAAIGVIAAVIGTAGGLAGWIAVAPRLETALEHRVDRFDVPWWVVTVGVLLAVVTATGSAWWPARSVARVSTMQALSGRPPRPSRLRGSSALAGLLIVVGVVCLLLADRTNSPLLVAGTLATVLGVLSIGPLGIRAVAGLAERSTVAVRLALRDLARFQSRSGVELAAITLALGIATAIVIESTAAAASAGPGNLSERQLLVRIDTLDWPDVPLRTAAEIDGLQTEVDRIADLLDGPSVFALDMAVDPEDEPESYRGDSLLPAAQIGDAADTARGPLYVATPELLRRYGLDPDELDPDTDVVTAQPGGVSFRNPRVLERSELVDIEVVTNVERIDADDHTSVPTSLITPDALRRRGWEPARKGWFIEADEPLTSGQLTDARSVAAAAGLTLEARDSHREQTMAALRSGATAAGMLVALAVLAMTVGLIRAEVASDLRTLTAVGARRSTRRFWSSQ